MTVAGDATKFEFACNSFDCVFCTEVLEHIPELQRACNEIVRIARHEIIVGVPFEQDPRVRALYDLNCPTARSLSTRRVPGGENEPVAKLCDAH